MSGRGAMERTRSGEGVRDGRRSLRCVQKEPDEHGRRNIMIHPSEQVIIPICTLQEGTGRARYHSDVTAEGVRPRGTEWERPTLYRSLEDRPGYTNSLPRRPKEESGLVRRNKVDSRDRRSRTIQQARVLRTGD